MGRKSLKTVRQKEIIAAFYRVARKEGLENASLAKVAKEMGVNTSLVLHYFDSKEDLIFGLINYILDRYKSMYTTESNKDKSGSRLIMIINNLFSRKWNMLFDDGVFYSCFALVFRDNKVKEAYRELHEYLRSMLTEAIKEAHSNGKVSVNNPEKTANLIFILVEGAYYYLSLYDTNDNYYKKLNEYREAAFDILKIENHGTAID
jgi:AcrR family transcriptional regulator